MNPPDRLAEHIPRRLFVRHIAAALDVPPRHARYVLANLIDARQAGHARHRWCSPDDLIAYAVTVGESIDWLGVIDVDLGA